MIPAPEGLKGVCRLHPSLQSSLRRYSVQKHAVAIAFPLSLEESKQTKEVLPCGLA